ncbi:MAG TPA: cyanophycin synthetase, partial [Syntrophales bacterium]|nr:cyanophycin synthetase [Syntrophales bacterium]
RIQEGIAALAAVPGRLEKVSRPGEPVVFVDYAHKEDALRKVLETLSAFRERRIITVFGCGGDRDRTKRPLMGRAAGEMSDLAVVTSDNPRTEDPLEIIDQIEAGLREASLKKYRPEDFEDRYGGQGYVVLPDRREAIRRAVAFAGPGDIVLIAGKGHEDYQIIGTEKRPFDDRQVARGALDERGRRRASG